MRSRTSGDPAFSSGPAVRRRFHPAGDRLARELRSQFETRTSNGGLTAHPGGDRWRWESRIFGSAYDDHPAAERPKYGSLNHLDRSYGGSPRFGSSYFRLAEHTLDRTTFCYPDSYTEPDEFGTSDRMSLIERARAATDDDPIDRYIEAHVHGHIDIATDVEALVLDPSYRGTDTDTVANTLPCLVLWHPGYRVGIDEIERHPEYRGERIVEVARAVACDGVLTPHIIGLARGSSIDPQDLKKVWHYLARFGSPVIHRDR